MWRLISSGSLSEIEEPSSTLPIRVTAPGSKSAASTSEVFPEPTMSDHGDVANLFRAIDVHNGVSPFTRLRTGMGRSAPLQFLSCLQLLRLGRTSVWE